MIYLVEMDHMKSATPLTKEMRRDFIKEIILPTLALVESYQREGKIIAGGTVTGKIGLRLIMQVEAPQQLERLLMSIPLWLLAEVRVTPISSFAERRENVQLQLELLETH
jgi:muconolactone delta-isomerase